MTAPDLVAELARLGVAVRVAKGLPALSHPDGHPEAHVAHLRAALKEHRAAVLAELGYAVERCPLCLADVCPARAGGQLVVAGCDRMPLEYTLIDQSSKLTVVKNPRCPFGGER